MTIKTRTILLFLIGLSLCEDIKELCLNLTPPDVAERYKKSGKSLFDIVDESKPNSSFYFRSALYSGYSSSLIEKKELIKDFQLYRPEIPSYARNELILSRALRDNNHFETLLGCFSEITRNDISMKMNGKYDQSSKDLEHVYFIYENKIPFKYYSDKNENRDDFNKLNIKEKINVLLQIATDLQTLKSMNYAMMDLSFYNIKVDLKNKGRAEILNLGKIGEINAELRVDYIFEPYTAIDEKHVNKIELEIFAFGRMAAEAEYGGKIFRNTDGLFGENRKRYNEIVIENINNALNDTDLNKSKVQAGLHKIICACVQFKEEDRIRLEDLVLSLKELSDIAGKPNGFELLI
jgi:hypothetical protein